MSLSGHYDEHNEQRIGKLRDNWKKIYKLDLDNLVQPVLFRILSNYLDQGIAIFEFPVGNTGFLNALKSWRKTVLPVFLKPNGQGNYCSQDDLSIEALLQMVVGDEAYFEQYLFDQQFSHRGWSGMVATIEDKPESLLSRREISLHDLIIFELLLEIDHLEHQLGPGWQSSL